MRRFLPLILGLSVALGLAYSRFYYVGYFNDDAFYIIRAQSLFHAVGLNPFPPAVAAYGPGFPLFLSPFVAFLGPQWGALRFVMIALGLVSCLAAARLFRPWLAPGAFLVFFCLYVLNPFVVGAASWVMSEAWFIFLTLCIFCLLRWAIAGDEPHLGWLLGVLLGWAMVVRPTGAILAPGVAAGLICSRRWKGLAQALGVAFAIWGAVILQNYHFAHSPSGYWPQWKESLSYVGHPLVLLDNLNRVANLFFVAVPLGIQLPYSAGGFTANAAISFVMLVLAGRGVRVIAKQSQQDRALILAVVVFCLGYLGIHSLWTQIDRRYAFPILPFLLAFTVAGAHSLWDKAHGPSLRPFLLGPLLVLFIVFGNARWVGSELDRTSRPAGRFPEATLEWIRGHTPPDAVLLAARGPALFLYSGRRCVVEPSGSVQDREEFRFQLLREGITYVLDQPFVALYGPMHSVRPNELNRQRLSWAASWPEAFRPVYRNAGEGTTLYGLVKDDSFLKAFELYLAARGELDQARFEAGFKGLELALAEQPRLVKALNAYGAACVLSGRHLAAGETKLKQALEIEPECFWAWLNLARLYRKTGHPQQARDAFDHARSVLSRSPGLAAMGPVVAREAGE